MRSILLSVFVVSAFFSIRTAANSESSYFALIGAMEAGDSAADSALKGNYAGVEKKNLKMLISDLDEVSQNWTSSYSNGYGVLRFAHSFISPLKFDEKEAVYHTTGRMLRNGCAIPTYLSLSFSANSNLVKATVYLPSGVDPIRCSGVGSEKKSLFSLERVLLP